VAGEFGVLGLLGSGAMSSVVVASFLDERRVASVEAGE